MEETTPTTPPQSGGDVQLIREISTPLFTAKGWLKLLGVLMIIEGALMVLTIVGIIICWLPIWIGVLLLRSAGSIEVAQLSGDKVQFVEAMRRLKTVFTIYGVLALLALIAMVVAMLVGGMGVFTSALMNS
ncbi:MAG: hypothetical protein GF400_09335 [Candidatus Eisenbacteria bacterium]|nr:hypothetical protein [Candidatus Eisenbacteria bacterium]